MIAPGEEITLTIEKEGKEPEQGIGYLDDGTMVVVEGARRHVGGQVAAVVASFLHNLAGKIVFAHLRGPARSEAIGSDHDLPASSPAASRGGRSIPELHQAYVDHLKWQDHIRTPSVEAAFRAVPRHLFVPGHPVEEVYDVERAIGVRASDGSYTSNPYDRPWKSSSSQPAVYAIMLEQLQLEPGQRVLEIAAGTGYNAALMAHIVGGQGRVTTVDIDAEMAERARRHVESAGFRNVRVVCADGALGFPQDAPYDRIIVTVGVWDVAPAWRDQLSAQGRLLLPLMMGVDRTHQLTVAFERADDHLRSVSVSGCGFMFAYGVLGGPAIPLEELQFSLYAEENGDDPPMGEIVFHKRWNRLVCHGPGGKRKSEA
jgi:protein-L-isoaspartate(D-aspartate) O-methyltransferase